MGGGPRGRNVISTEGYARALHFSPAPFNLKLSIDIFIMSVSHIFADFRLIFVKCSCSRRDGTSLFSLFYKIIVYIQGSRLRPNHFLRVCE